MVEGIDVTGQSLLSRPRQSVKRQDTNELKERAIEFLLKRADDYFTTRYDDWFKGESARVASRALKDQEKFLQERKTYEDELFQFGGSAFDFEKQKVRTLLTDDFLKQRLVGFEDYSLDDRNRILEGDNTDENPGLINKIAEQRLQAREEYGEALKNLKLDPFSAREAFKKLNPNSRNLVGAGISALQQLGFGKGSVADKQKLVNDQLNKIKADRDAANTLRQVRNNGFNLDEAIKIANEDLKINILERVGTPVGSPQLRTEKDFVEVDGRIFEKEIKYYEQVSRLANGNFRVDQIPITSEQGSSQQVKDSKAFINQRSKNSIVQRKENVKDPVTNIEYENIITHVLDANGSSLRVINNKQFKSAEEERIFKDPTFADISSEQLQRGYKVFLGNQEELLLPDAATNSLTRLPLITKDKNFDAASLKAVEENLGGNQLLVTRQLGEDYTEIRELFGRKGESLIASQLLVIDSYVPGFLEEEDLEDVGNKALRGASRNFIDPGKLLIAIDMLRSNGSLSVNPKTGEPLTDKQLRDIIFQSGILLAGEDTSFNSNKVGNSGDIYFDAAEVAAIRGLKIIIDEQDKGTGRKSLLESVVTTETFGSKGEKVDIHIYDLMLGNEIYRDSNGDPILEELQTDNIEERLIRELNVTTIDDIKDSRTKNLLLQKQQQYLTNIKRLEKFGLKGEDLTSKSLAPKTGFFVAEIPMGSKDYYAVGRLKAENNRILSNLDNILESREQQVKFFMTPPARSSLLENADG